MMTWKIVLFGLMTCVQASAQAQKLTYDDHVLPILENSCTNCHNPDKKKGDLDLTTYRGLMAGGSGGKVVVAGDGGGSKMFTTTAHTAEPFMPPKGDRLGKKEINIIRAWIDGGLLETKDSKAKKNNTPKIDFSGLDTNKPSGPPPIPTALDTNPVVVPAQPGFIAALESSPWAPVVAVTSQKQVLLYNTENFDLIGVLPFPNTKLNKGNPESLSFHPSGKYLLAGGGIQGKSGTTVTWDILTGKLIMQTGREYDSVSASSLRSDLKAVATSGPSRLIKMWQTADNSLLHNIKKHTDWVTSVSYSPDGVLLATADRNGGIHVWEAEAGNPFHTLRAHQKQVVSLKWSSDSNYLASASEDGTMRVWDINSGRELRKIDAHGNGVLDMDWSKKGQLISVGRDHTVKIWKPDYNLLKQFKYPGIVPTKVQWTHDGARFITADYSGKITVWDSKSHKPIGELKANPLKLDGRIAQVQKSLTDQQKIAEQKQSVLAQKIKQKQAHQKRINDTVAAQNAAQKAITDNENQIKQHQQKINQLNQKQKAEHDKLKQLNQNKAGVDQKMKQLHGQLAEFDKQLRASNQQAAQVNQLIEQLGLQIKQVKELLAKEPNNQDLQQKLIEANGKLVQAKLDGKKHQTVTNDIIKKKQAIDADTKKNHQSQQAFQKQIAALHKILHQCDAEKKSLWEVIKKKQQTIAHNRKILEQKKREIGPLKQQLPAMIEQEKKAKIDLESFQKTLVPIQQKLDRLRARKQ